MRLRTSITDPASTWERHAPSHLDYIAVCLHARRSRMAEGVRLDELCRIKSFPELAHAVFPGQEIRGLGDFQRALVNELIEEISALPAHVVGAGGDLLDWILMRFQFENLKVLMRACVTKEPAVDIGQYLADLPRALTLDVARLAAAESLEDFIRVTPRGPVRDALQRAHEIYSDNGRPFFLEAALDQAYFQGLIDRVERLRWEDREIVRPMVCQEADIFHLMLVIRGRFHYGLTPEILLPLHVQWTRIPQSLFARMLQDSDLNTSAGRASDAVLDGASVEGSREGPGTGTFGGAALERIAWTRFLRLANLAFRRSHMGLGAIVGYTGLRRVEVANLTTVSEGIGKGTAPGVIREHLILAGSAEAAHA